jgi:diadenosine tetraphosphatase ApaH/serine/threonine PP2A family protein phosphatase
MRYAIVSDIHSNLVALRAVLRDIEKRGGVSGVWCLGDTVGYGPDPNACIDTIRQYKRRLVVAGNHDFGAVDKLDTGAFNLHAAMACKWNGAQLGKRQRNYLSNLPTVVTSGDFTLVHGSPRDPLSEYVGSWNCRLNFPYFNTRVCLVGHSHVPQVWELLPGGEIRVRYVTHGMNVLVGKNRLIVNPGSIGQPRDTDRRASYAIYNDLTQTIVFYRVRYDIGEASQRERTSGLWAGVIRTQLLQEQEWLEGWKERGKGTSTAATGFYTWESDNGERWDV